MFEHSVWVPMDLKFFPFGLEVAAAYDKPAVGVREFIIFLASG